MIPFLLILFGSIAIVGVINRTGSVLSGRVGYRFLQPLYDVVLQLKKGTVRSSKSTFWTTFAPAFSLAALVVASMMVPLGSQGAWLAFRGDVIVFCMLLAAARVAMVMCAMDAGSSFQGMGAARDAFFSMLIEPALILLVATFCLITGRDSFSAIFARFDNMTLNMLILSVVVGYGLYRAAIVEAGRVPMADPATHLELTMTHEVMVLDLSSVDLAFFNIAGWFKLSIFALLVANALIPAQVGGLALFGLYFVVVLCYGVAIGVGESLRARNRMNKNSTFVASISALGLLAFIVAYMLLTNQLAA